jgi:hypothetical protein
LNGGQVGGLTPLSHDLLALGAELQVQIQRDAIQETFTAAFLAVLLEPLLHPDPLNTCNI